MNDDLWAARKQRARAYLKVRKIKWICIGHDDKGRPKYLAVDETTYHYDKDVSDADTAH